MQNDFVRSKDRDDNDNDDEGKETANRAKKLTNSLKVYMMNLVEEYICEMERAEGYEYWENTPTGKDVVEDLIEFAQNVLNFTDTTIVSQEFLAQKY